MAAATATSRSYNGNGCNGCSRSGKMAVAVDTRCRWGISLDDTHIIVSDKKSQHSEWDADDVFDNLDTNLTDSHHPLVKKGPFYPVFTQGKMDLPPFLPSFFPHRILPSRMG